MGKDIGMKETEYLPLYGEKIMLRPMEESDTQDIVRWRNTDFVRKNFIYQKLFTAEGHQHWIETMVKTGKVKQFMICPYLSANRECGNAVGSVYLRDIDPVHRKAEYGIFIGEADALGKGYGTEAAQLMLRYGFGELQLHKIMLRVLAENEGAKRSYEKAGFRQEAYLKDEVFLNGGYHDVILMAAFEPEIYRSRR